jgi:hypothetical protein
VQAALPAFIDPRVAAGAPLVDDVFQCTTAGGGGGLLVAPTADQLTAIKAIFPNGVCDYSKPGIGQTQKVTTWASFKGDGTFVGL